MTALPTRRNSRRRAPCARFASTPRGTSGLTVVGDSFHQFEPQGVTGTVLLAESHIAIHTWPEAGFVTVDVYVCNLQTDNTAKAEHVFRALEAALKPQRTRFQAIHRGGKDA